MALKYIGQEVTAVKTEVIRPSTASFHTKKLQKKPVNKLLFCVLILATLLTLNIVYNGIVCEKGTPLNKCIMTNSIFDLWGMGKKIPFVQKVVNKNYGVITGILYSEDKPVAVVSGKLVNEGMVIDGVKIVKIHKDNVEFQKDGRLWSQRIGEKPQ